MNRKIVLCFTVIFVVQVMLARTGSTLDIEDVEKVADQVSQTAMSISNHLMGVFYPSPADAQNSVEKIRTMMFKGFIYMQTEAHNIKEIVRKNADQKLVEMYGELEKELKKYFIGFKDIFEEVAKPVDEKMETKKIADIFITIIKNMEATVNKAIDGVKKQ